MEQVTIFDLMQEEKHEWEIGEWLDDGMTEWMQKNGKRVFFDDIEVGKLYIEDASTSSHKWYRVLEITGKDITNTGEDRMFLNDGSKTAKKGYMSTIRTFVDAKRRPKPPVGDFGVTDFDWLCDTNGWFYELPEVSAL